MTAAPRIGITGNTRTLSGADRSGVNASYVRAVARAGAIPLILPPLINPAHAARSLEGLEGLVLSGGEDIDPTHYGQEPHPSLGDVDPARDAMELAVFRAAWERRLPVLAICRGLQLVNVAMGGTLWQDLPSERPGQLPHAHTGGRDDRTHEVRIEDRSRLARALNTLRCDVNSFHHQAIRHLAPGLVISARAPDGEVEGVETTAGDPWLLAVQWHPEEFHHHQTAPEHGLFRALAEEAERAPR
jgi:putative glutamine amidotransferase